MNTRCLTRYTFSAYETVNIVHPTTLASGILTRHNIIDPIIFRLKYMFSPKF